MAVIADRCPGLQLTVVDLNAERIAVRPVQHLDLNRIREGKEKT